MFAAKICQKLWGQKLVAATWSVKPLLVSMYEEATGIPTVWVVSEDPADINLIPASLETFKSITLSDIFYEEMDLATTDETLIAILPPEAYNSTSHRKCSYYLGQILTDGIIDLCSRGKITAELEYSVLVALLRSVSSRVEAEVPDIRIASFQWGMATSAARYLGGIKNECQDKDQVFYSADFLHSSRFVNFMRTSDPHFDNDLDLSISSWIDTPAPHSHSLKSWMETLTCKVEALSAEKEKARMKKAPDLRSEPICLQCVSYFPSLPKADVPHLRKLAQTPWEPLGN